ncbi:MAG: hypothetical protein C3F11_12825 [Methylocystaceae bacterium]|nr:MAG: hypothetical protein C3F11_12825 [Methylocystaceae bacterium]
MDLPSSVALLIALNRSFRPSAQARRLRSLLSAARNFCAEGEIGAALSREAAPRVMPISHGAGSRDARAPHLRHVASGFSSREIAQSGWDASLRGPAEKKLRVPRRRHCEERELRSNPEAAGRSLDCFASLAMTAEDATIHRPLPASGGGVSLQSAFV